jgi:hypothetical protein
MVRKFIVIDVNAVVPDELLALAATILALVIVHWSANKTDAVKGREASDSFPSLDVRVCKHRAARPRYDPSLLKRNTRTAGVSSLMPAIAAIRADLAAKDPMGVGEIGEDHRQDDEHADAGEFQGRGR